MRHLADRALWECRAYGGGDAVAGTPSVEVSVEAATAKDARAGFVDAWNTTIGTSWAPEEFQFVSA